jgi:hypothetical protein
MIMIMEDRSKRLSEPLRWGRRERTAVAAVLACVALALAGLVAYGVTSGSSGRADCVTVTFASTVGGADLHGCGPQARRICASGDFHRIAGELKLACERAGFPYRAPS